MKQFLRPDGGMREREQTAGVRALAMSSRIWRNKKTPPPLKGEIGENRPDERGSFPRKLHPIRFKENTNQMKGRKRGEYRRR